MVCKDNNAAQCICGKDDKNSNSIKCTKTNCQSKWWHTECAGIGKCISSKDVAFCKHCPWTCPSCVLTPFNAKILPQNDSDDDQGDFVLKKIVKLLPSIVKTVIDDYKNNMRNRTDGTLLHQHDRVKSQVLKHKELAINLPKQELLKP